jgi:histidinol-phosphate aminotransferase
MLGPSPMALKAIRDNLGSLHEYRFEHDGLLRRAISTHINLPGDQIITANSGMELLDLICRGFVDEHGEVILSSPTFMAYKNFANLSGGRVVDVPLLAGDFALDVNGILNAITDHTRLVFISNPNNPTGSVAPKASLDPLLALLPEHVAVVYDEVYHHYVHREDYPISMIKPNIFLVILKFGYQHFTRRYAHSCPQISYCFLTQRLCVK